MSICKAIMLVLGGVCTWCFGGDCCLHYDSYTALKNVATYLSLELFRAQPGIFQINVTACIMRWNEVSNMSNRYVFTVCFIRYCMYVRKSRAMLLIL